MRAELRGPDHVELGDIASAAAGARAAIAITRGRYPKAYHYVDPNEDVAVAAAGRRATLLIVCDGHNGATAPLRAADAVVEELGDDPPPGLSGPEWLGLFGRVNEEVLAATGGGRGPASRTVLLVALVAGRALSWGAMGDAALVLARPGFERGRQLNREATRFVGSPLGRRGLAGAVDRGGAELGPEDWVVLATDGLSEFINPMRPADVVPRVLARAGGFTGHPAPEAAARALVETACDAGAGDNVAVALLAP